MKSSKLLNKWYMCMSTKTQKRIIHKYLLKYFKILQKMAAIKTALKSKKKINYSNYIDMFANEDT